MMPLRYVLHRLDTTRHFLKWLIELSQFDITFAPRTVIKAQVLANFLVKITFPEKTNEIAKEPQKFYVDGSSANTRAGARVILIGPNKQSLTTTIKFDFHASNNEAEYVALINGLDITMTMGVQHLKVSCDSQLSAYQMSGEYEARGEWMIWYQ